MNKPILTLVVPCWGRPARTRRLINNVLAQTENNWEAFIIGDGCPIFQTLIDSGEADFYMNLAKEKGNKLYVSNAKTHTGNWGQLITDQIIDKATGKYFIFAGNDDILKPNHFSHYLSEIKDTDYDMVAYPHHILPNNRILIPKWESCQVGHGNIIIKTLTLQKAPKVTASPTHDWSLINELLLLGAKTKLADSREVTYLATSVNSQQSNESYKSDIID
jgi:hypothetical protein